jgi:hypothetical protein
MDPPQHDLDMPLGLLAADEAFAQAATSLAVTNVAGPYGFLALRSRLQPMKARIPFDNRKVARTFAVVTYAFSLLLAFFAGALSDTHAVGLAPHVLIPGLGLAVLSPFVWFGARWAMILVFLIGVALESAVGIASGDWWFFLAFPVVLGMLTLLHAMARPSDSRPTSQAAAINKVHAGLVYAYSFAAALAAPIYHTYRLGAPIVSSYGLFLGIALGAMSYFIWRGASWAMIVVCALVTMQWLVLGSLDSAFWANSVYSAPPLVFALLTVASILVGKVRAT